MPQFRIGTDDFKELIDEGGYFVDKTLLIREIIEGSKVTLLPRPRRFGKTLNMTMLRYFFEKTEISNAYLFEGLEIAKYPEYMKHQGQYPVIYLSLKDFKRASFESFLQAVQIEISRLFQTFSHIQSILDNGRKERFLRICREEGDIDDYYSSLKELILYCYQYYQKPVIVIIDEYDAPMIEAWTNGYYDKISQFMRFWLGGSLKPDNALALYRAVVTGILRVAKESIFSELNNLKVCTTLQQNNLASMFGFTEEDINKILHDFQITEHGLLIREWYNGYLFGSNTIYNPWSVTTYIDNLPDEPGPHWLNTSSNLLIYEELEAGGPEIKRDLEHLLSGQDLRYPLSETITFKDIGISPSNIWSFLYFSGYLCADDPQPDIRGRSAYRLSIPNKEISFAYETFIERIYPGKPGGLDALMDWFIHSNPVIELEKLLQDLALQLVSMYDLAKLPEAVFHAFVLGLLANLRYVYEIRSNPESGYGRADIIMVPKSPKYPTAYVIEFKSISQKKDLIRSCSSALAQIRERGYPVVVHNVGIPLEQIRSLAIILQGKQVMVGEEGVGENRKGLGFCR